MEAGGLLPRQSQQPGPPGPNQLQPQIVNSINQQLQQEQQQQQQLHQNIQLQQQQQQQMGQAPEIVPRGSQVASSTVERLRKRMGVYRERHKDLEPKFDRSFHGICEQGIQETLLLKQRFVDNSKAKRQPKKNDKKQNDTVISTTLSNNIHVQQKFLKRPTDDLDSTGVNNETAFGEPPIKLQCTQSSSASIGHPQQQSNNSTPNSGSGNNVGGAATGTQPAPPNNQQGKTSNNCNNGNSSGNTTNEDIPKFSLEIVQRLEFSTASSQAQQISTNVTVKALTNASVKSEHLNSSSPIKTEQSTTTTTSSNTSAQTSSNSCSASGNGGSATINTSNDMNSLVECKQEPDNDFDDLEQCAAALEKDPSIGFPGLIVDFMNDEAGHEGAFKDFFSEFPDFHPQINFGTQDLDFEDKPLEGPNNGIKIEDDKERVHHHPPQQQHHHHHQQQQQQQQQQQGSLSAQYSPGANRMAYSGLDFKSEMSPAAQTLKHMAEQHQHKNQQLSGGGFNPTAAAAAAARGPNARSPYAEFNQYGNVTSDYLNSPQGPISSQVPSNVAFHKNNGANSVPVAFQAQQPDNMYVQQQRAAVPSQNNASLNKSANILGSGGPTGSAGSGYKQQFSPYGSPGSMPNHGSPGYPLPSRMSQGPNQGSGSQAGFNSSTPPRPPSGSGASNIQINQAQQLHINSAHSVQVSAGQHMQLSGDLKPGNVSVAAHQGIYFNQQQQQPPSQQQHGAPNNQNETYCSVSQSQTINFTQQSLRRGPAASGVGSTGSSQQQTRTHPGQPQSTQIQQQQQQHPAAGAQLTEQHHAKLLQHNLMRAQQQQQQRQHLSSTVPNAIIRPPPPDYNKAAQAQMVHGGGGGMGQQPRLSGPMRRINQQSIPPSGPMMRPQMGQQTTAMHPSNNPMYIGTGGVNIGTGAGTVPGNMSAIGGIHQMQQKIGFPRTNNPRSPSINLGSTDGIGNGIPSRGGNQNWQQQIFIQQQQQQQHHQGGFGNGNNIHINASQVQHQQMLRSQISGSGMNNIPLQQQIVLPQQQQQQQQQQINNQMGMQLQMSQTQTMSTVTSNNGNGSSMIPHQYSTANPATRGTMQSTIHSQQQQLADNSVNATDLGLDFFDNLQAGDTSNCNPQELLNLLDFDSML